MKIGEKIKALREGRKLSQNKFAEICGWEQARISHYETGRREPRLEDIAHIQEVFGVDLLSTHPEKLHLDTPPSEGDEVHEIELFYAKGSCGGGVQNHEDLRKGTLTRDAQWFQKFEVKPENCKAIYADGDSMSDFIVDGDIVIFDISKTEPASRKIFLLRYPEGLRIKELFQQVSGKWKIKSRNPTWHDEEIADSDDIEIIGQFVYRQGG